MFYSELGVSAAGFAVLQRIRLGMNALGPDDCVELNNLSDQLNFRPAKITSMPGYMVPRKWYCHHRRNKIRNCRIRILWISRIRMEDIFSSERHYNKIRCVNFNVNIDALFNIISAWQELRMNSRGSSQSMSSQSKRLMYPLQNVCVYKLCTMTAFSVSALSVRTSHTDSS